MKFFLPLVPPTTTSQQKGATIFSYGAPCRVCGRKATKGVRFYKKKKVKDAEELITKALLSHRPAKPLSCPVYLILVIVWPWRASERKSTIETGQAPHTVFPDCDNAGKLIQDCMTHLGFWEDDSQVSAITWAKRRGPIPGIGVWVNEDKMMIPLPTDNARANGFASALQQSLSL